MPIGDAAEMIFAFLDDGAVSVVADEVAARRTFEAIDVENRDVVFYGEDGTWLKPRYRPRERSFVRRVFDHGDFELTASSELDGSTKPFDVAILSATAIEPNPFFDSIEAIKRHVASRRGEER
jgi:hypothetical protein